MRSVASNEDAEIRNCAARWTSHLLYSATYRYDSSSAAVACSDRATLPRSSIVGPDIVISPLTLFAPSAYASSVCLSHSYMIPNTPNSIKFNVKLFHNTNSQTILTFVSINFLSRIWCSHATACHSSTRPILGCCPGALSLVISMFRWLIWMYTCTTKWCKMVSLNFCCNPSYLADAGNARKICRSSGSSRRREFMSTINFHLLRFLRINIALFADFACFIFATLEFWISASAKNANHRHRASFNIDGLRAGSYHRFANSFSRKKIAKWFWDGKYFTAIHFKNQFKHRRREREKIIVFIQDFVRISHRARDDNT